MPCHRPCSTHTPGFISKNATRPIEREYKCRVKGYYGHRRPRHRRGRRRGGRGGRACRGPGRARETQSVGRPSRRASPSRRA